ncbi:hypothetical protein N657DRAFT_278168 [Parathielavia appendiculata]|uniref:Secreted protein n=1 Tax=Parathielavia appendiculata TaxID=2587402 RepID=A0AAN6U3G8_9PEZI|nr:hypothetical protein N657DRAFT_278168 [Parathielavia appendiculata]
MEVCLRLHTVLLPGLPWCLATPLETFPATYNASWYVSVVRTPLRFASFVDARVTILRISRHMATISSTGRSCPSSRTARTPPMMVGVAAIAGRISLLARPIIKWEATKFLVSP